MRIWTECTRMTAEEVSDSAQEARELSEVFATIADILEKMMEKEG